MRLGLVTLAGGMCLYVGAAIGMLAYERPRPGWLAPLWLGATGLVAVGLLVLVNGAVRAYRERL
jgi:hypothetical protein